MHTLKSILPEITFVTGSLMVIIAMFLLMGWQYALFFGGGVLILVSSYVNEIMQVEVTDE